MHRKIGAARGTLISEFNSGNSPINLPNSHARSLQSSRACSIYVRVSTVQLTQSLEPQMSIEASFVILMASAVAAAVVSKFEQVPVNTES